MILMMGVLVSIFSTNWIIGLVRVIEKTSPMATMMANESSSPRPGMD
jgi:hypothetical protein